MGKFANLTKSTPSETDTNEVIVKDIKIPSKISPKISNEISTAVRGEISPYTDVVRKAVKWPGKESAPLRITEAELTKLKSVVRYFEDRGYYTDRTQLIRIALNFMLDDFERNTDTSYLSQIMDRINNY